MRRSQRWRSSTPRMTSRKKVAFFVLLLTFLFSIQSVIFVEKNLRPPLMNLAKIRLKQIATQSLNSAITERIAQNTDYEKLIDWRTDLNGKTTGFMLNYAEHMRITSETKTIVQNTMDTFKVLKERIPLGEAFNSAILASFGPHVPIRLIPAGAVKVELSTRYQNAGINMLLVEVFVHIIAEVTIVIPFDTELEVVETELPISYVLVVGEVPTYYFDSKGNPIGNSAPLPPTLSLPNSTNATSGGTGP